MPPIQLRRDTIRNLLNGEVLTLDELAVVVSEGTTDSVYGSEDASYFDVAWEMTREVLPEILSDLEMDSPTIFLMDEDSSICPASITFLTCNDRVSFPLFNIEAVEDEIRNLLTSIPTIGADEYPSEIESQNEIWTNLALNAKRRVLGILSSYYCRGEDGFSPSWLIIDMWRIEDEVESPFLVALTATDSEGLSSVSCWADFWNALIDHDGPRHRTTWLPNSNLEVIRRDTQNSRVYFKLQDDDGYESFTVNEQSFDQLVSFLTSSGWSFIETTSSSTTMVSGNNNYGTVNQQPQNFGSNNRPAPVSPTPGVRPTQQRPGASVDSGIISGNVNISGLAQINGIVQGDVSVPSGADVNLNGIVQGTVRINGGTARLYGTISAASISAGRLEIYGILQTPLQYSGGDVYYDPNSIIG
jgi:hypothetical protein